MLSDIKTIVARPLLPQIICMVVLVLLLAQIITSFMAFSALHHEFIPRADLFNDITNESKQTSLTLGLTTPYFGDYVPKDLNESGVKQSLLDLTVVGIMFAESGEASHVIIRAAGGREQTFQIGDTLPGDAVIKRITPDGVFINREGLLESLSLPKNELTFERPAKP